MIKKDSIQISVIIPAYQDPDGLENTVASLLDQSFPRDNYEIIIVDNGSKDDTPKIAQILQRNFTGLIRFESEDKIQSSYAARNKGVRIARGKLICFIDADMIASKDYLIQVFQCFQTNDIDYLGCQVNITGTQGTLTEKFNRISGFPIKTYLERHNFVCTCCLSVRKEIFEKIGFFDERIKSGGDNEFGQRTYHAGLRQFYCDDIVISHPARWAYSQMIAKSKRIGRGHAQLCHYYPERYQYILSRYISLKPYRPFNPVNTFKRCRTKHIDISWPEAIIISFFHIPLEFMSMIVFFWTRRRLANR